mmetsp:Transcript_37924/g.107159  ORF Transcript_37924/g.107159 Transcript_37924/m.107159 type:complete len:204 (+) Transcript_37924:210-821(+)
MCGRKVGLGHKPETCFVSCCIQCPTGTVQHTGLAPPRAALEDDQRQPQLRHIRGAHSTRQEQRKGVVCPAAGEVSSSTPNSALRRWGASLYSNSHANSPTLPPFPLRPPIHAVESSGHLIILSFAQSASTQISLPHSPGRPLTPLDVRSTAHYQDYSVQHRVKEMFGQAMEGLIMASLPADPRIALKEFFDEVAIGESPEGTI